MEQITHSTPARKVTEADVYGYQVILADPPWRFRSNSLAAPGRNPCKEYACLSVEQLCRLPLKERVAQNAILFLCVPGPHLVVGAHAPLARAWGFEPTAIGFVWVKLNPKADASNFTLADLAIGPGLTTRKNCEFVIICKRGKSLRRDAGVHEVIVAPRREHSRKPDELYRRIERYVGHEGGPYIDLFGRETRPGWITWGLEATKFDPPGASPSSGDVP